MGKSLTYKILENNLISGELKPGSEITVKVNQTLTQDSTGTMVYLQLEAMNIKDIKTDLSVAYIDHNTLQAGFENADDHEFIKSAAAKYGIIYSKPGNGICHQLHLERFGKPGTILLGSDSHTPTAGGLGMIGIGAGGLDVAAAMATGTYTLKVPKVLNIELHGKLKTWVSAKDVILYILKKLTVKGGVGYIIEYSGEGVVDLSLTDRATITNMGAELGATTSIFPSDENTLDFLTRQERTKDYEGWIADEGAIYDKKLVIDLDKITPMAAMPHSPDNVAAVKDIEKIKVDQIAIGSCTNSSYTDLMKVAAILKGKRVHPDVSLVISPGSSNILKMMSDEGALGDLISAGARILEASCGPCIGMGQAPKSKAISLRTFNRNFKGRCGTKDADVYIISPETAAVSALTGYLTDPSECGLDFPKVALPDKFAVYENYFIYPPKDREGLEVVMGPNIKPFPLNEPLIDTMEIPILLKTKDNVTTDDIMPSNAKLLPFRSNIPELSKYCFGTLVDDFHVKAKAADGGIVIGGDNYGQGSSREHAALVPLYLGIKAVIAKSFARIHKANLINSGILPLVFKNISDYEKFDETDVIVLNGLINSLDCGKEIEILNKTKSFSCTLTFDGSKRDVELLKSGGYLNYVKNNK
ncbi:MULTISPECIES: aconitate hydratase [Psychrilyobacter]|uniref:Aconitate hydratase n=1 Tax=Psychrilyobacter piezotolerans TaxID=2293438 RepID=A0ABX9KEC3_9FUSO|nr:MULTISPECIES: aconitate hydratase [Psychrilyobacter]MCS5422517.1 aconitate hydratase [Psychrilyobacter sp. S5]NDI78743.1 aconitate hydratase [Psychrilyobacter piezotolerans]RDE59591.1 aconitate hydratase [Psychrilyobacter sp. S5]REI40005.1 aconitate hydratase [Psychrilyobacter piezotolerans]